MHYSIMDRVFARDASLGVVPLYEHGVDYPIICEVMGYSKKEEIDRLTFFSRCIKFYEQMGYPYASIEMGPKFPEIKQLSGKGEKGGESRDYVDENDGPIRTIEDVRNNALWLNENDIFDYELFEKALNLLPPHMKAVGGCSGGPFEHATFLMGLTNFCMALYEDPELIEELLDRIGRSLVAICERIVTHEKLGIYRFGDDLGFTQGTMISPEAIRRYIMPWQKKVVDVVHKNGKKFLLHSCGRLNDIMDDLIGYVGIDAKHSYEDKGTPVTEAKKLWGDRIAILGGLDVDFLCRADEKAIYDRTMETLKICSAGGGYAAGSGNTITSYMPVKNYLAMVKAVNDFNGTK